MVVSLYTLCSSAFFPLWIYVVVVVFFFHKCALLCCINYIFCLFDSIISICMLLHGLPIQLWLVLVSFNFLGGEKTIPVSVIRFIITSINKRAAGKRAFSLLIMRLYSRRIGKWF